MLHTPHGRRKSEEETIWEGRKGPGVAGGQARGVICKGRGNWTIAKEKEVVRTFDICQVMCAAAAAVFLDFRPLITDRPRRERGREKP